MKIDDTGRVLSFSEKPKGDDLKAMVILENLTVSELNLLQILKLLQSIDNKYFRQ